MKSNAFASVPLAPLNDEIIKVNEAFRKDTRQDKLNLSLGVYRLENGVLPVFESVKLAEQAIIADEIQSGGGKAYAPIEGQPEFCAASKQIIFGAGSSQDNITTVQAIGGSGALTLAAIFARLHLDTKVIHLTQPCWANHPGIFELQGLALNSIPYYNKENCRLETMRTFESLRALPANSVVLFQGACHNPSGMDLGNKDWETLADICEQRHLIPIIDLAYQGLAHSLEEDAFAAQLFAKRALPCFIAHSFSKSLSLYGERVGSLSVITDSAKSAQAVKSQLKNIIRPLYSNSPVHGAKIAAHVINKPNLLMQWQTELQTLRQRILSLRRALVSELKALGVDQELSHISEGNGMFALLKLSPQQVAELAAQHAIYLVADGRTCIPALSLESTKRLARALSDALKGKN